VDRCELEREELSVNRQYKRSKTINNQSFEYDTNRNIPNGAETAGIVGGHIKSRVSYDNSRGSYQSKVVEITTN